MATSKVSVFRKYHGPIPTDGSGQRLPREYWPRKRLFRWAVRWYNPEGRRFSKSFASRKEAERFAEAKQAEVRVGKGDPPGPMSLAAYAEMYLDLRGDVTVRTRIEHERTLRFLQDFFGKRKLIGRITPLDARRFVSSYRQRKYQGRSPAPATVNKIVRECQRIFGEAVACRLIRENPFAGLRQQKVGERPWHYVAPGEFRRLIEECPSPRWRGMITLGYCCGLRLGELLNITWADVDFGAGQLRVVRKSASERQAEWVPKDKDMRILPLPNEAVNVLTELQLDASDGQQYVFVNSSGPDAGNRLKRQNIWRDFQVIRRRAGVEKCSLHDLRKSYCTNLAGAVPLHVVQELAGHADIRTTRKHYLKVRAEQIESARQALDRVMRDAAISD